MNPIRFGRTDRLLGRSLVGVFHAAEGAPSPTAVLLCPPFGQEAIRIHRFQRVLSERLARAGQATLRFDYFGTGDSAGDDLDGCVKRWRDDILQADTELRRLAACGEVVWVGARLGATLAMQAGTQAEKPPARIVAWEPVIDGRAYLHELAHEHVRAISSPYRAPVAPASDRPDGEALGFAMSAALIDEIACIDEGSVAAWSGPKAVIAHAGDGTLRQWSQGETAQGRPCAWHALPERFEWTAGEAMNTALVPQPALQCLLQVIQEPCT
jgi:hypothetical protein